MGFPGETEEQFEATMDLVRRVRPDIVNVTRFSARPGTPAASMAEPVPGRRVKERSRRVTSLRFAIARRINEAFVGRTTRALVTETGKPGTMLARTPEYRQVVLADEVSIGEFVDVAIDAGRATDLRGHVLPDGLYTAEGIHARSPVV